MSDLSSKSALCVRVAKLLSLAAVGLVGIQLEASAQQSPDTKTWDIQLGGGAMYEPDYEGSDDYEISPVPFVAISYRDLVFLRGPSLGVNLVTVPGPGGTGEFQFGPLVRYEMGRDESDNDALRGLGDIDASVEVGGFASYEWDHWSFGLTAFQDVGDAHDGLTAELSGGYSHSFGTKFQLRTEVSTTWADDNYTEAFFGVTAAQAQRSGLRQYEAEGGFKDVGLTVNLDYSLTEHWGVTGLIGYKRLLGDAADSPIVDDEGSVDQLMTGVFVSYRF